MHRFILFCVVLVALAWRAQAAFVLRQRYPTIIRSDARAFIRKQPPSLYALSSSNEVSQTNITTTMASNNSTSSSSALTLQQQAQALRAEATLMEQSLQQEKERKQQKEVEAVDKWIDTLLLVNITTSDSNIEMLNTVERVTTLLQEGRFSQDHVNKMFDRISELSGPQSRSKCSPLVELLVDACGKLDCIERDDNPNKRWNGKVERVLRKRLFAMDWGIDLEDKDDESKKPSIW